MKRKKLSLSGEMILILLIVLLCAVISILNPTFFTVGNFCDIIRSSTVNGLYAVGVMLVLISGGIDISFPSIAAFAMYATVKIFNGIGYTGTFLLPLLVSAVFGFCLGSFNALLIYKFKIPTLIATLGTANLFNGILLTFLGSAQINTLPKGYSRFTKTYLLKVASDYGMSSIPIAVIVWIVVALIVWYILKYTLLGRGVYALGGNRVSAERVGMNIPLIHWFIYGTAGTIAGMAGTINTALKRTCNPFDAIGIELTIIAAVVLGGVKITGGKGSMLGTVLGVLMFTIINNSLIMVGVSTYWQRSVIGILILLSTSITAIQDRRSAARLLQRS